MQVYGFGKSEELIGDLMKKTGTTPAIATKFAPLPFRFGADNVVNTLKVSELGMYYCSDMSKGEICLTKSMLEIATCLTPQVLLQASLRRLQRESVELYQVGILISQHACMDHDSAGNLVELIFAETS